MITTIILALRPIGDDGRQLTTSGSSLGDPSSHPGKTYKMTNSHSGGDAYQPQLETSSCDWKSAVILFSKDSWNYWLE